MKSRKVKTFDPVCYVSSTFSLIPLHLNLFLVIYISYIQFVQVSLHGQMMVYPSLIKQSLCNVVYEFI